MISGKRSKFVNIICSQLFYLRRGFKLIQILIICWLNHTINAHTRGTMKGPIKHLNEVIAMSTKEITRSVIHKSDISSNPTSAQDKCPTWGRGDHFGKCKNWDDWCYAFSRLRHQPGFSKCLIIYESYTTKQLKTSGTIHE